MSANRRHRDMHILRLKLTQGAIQTGKIDETTDQKTDFIFILAWQRILDYCVVHSDVSSNICLKVCTCFVLTTPIRSSRVGWLKACRNNRRCLPEIRLSIKRSKIFLETKTKKSKNVELLCNIKSPMWQLFPEFLHRYRRNLKQGMWFYRLI